MEDARPKAVISLDFELRWGGHDVYGLARDAYRGRMVAQSIGIEAIVEDIGPALAQ